jgi:hypothetical protein
MEDPVVDPGVVGLGCEDASSRRFPYQYGQCLELHIADDQMEGGAVLISSAGGSGRWGRANLQREGGGAG